MRKLKLLLAACALLGGGLSANAYQTPVADGIYYLYNTACTDGTPGFMSTGNAYGFQVVIDNFGFPVKLIDVGNGNFQFQFIHHEGYLSDDSWMYSDGGNTGDNARARTITIQDQGDGNYKLLNTNNSKEIEDWYGNVVGDGTGNRHNYLWKFLSKAERDAIVAGYTTSVKLAAATSMGMPASVDTEEEFDDYLSTNYIGVDQSVKITNGTFTTEHNTTDWSTTSNSNRKFDIGWGNNDPKDTPEIYEGAGYLTHTTITVDKVGLYKVSVNAFYRCGNGDNNNRIGELGYDGSVAYLKANDNISKVCDWYSGKINGNGPGSPSVANSTYFSAGKYMNEVYVYVGDAKTIDISLHSHAFTWGGWLVFNNFKLTYYSDEVSDEDATAILATATTLESQIMQASVLSALSSAKSTFNSSRTIANYNALNTAISNANASKTAYANAKDYFDKIEELVATTNFYTAEAYTTNYSIPKAKYDDRTMTTEEGNSLVYGSRVTGGMPAILLSPWTVGDKTAIANGKPYINTWSVEGNTDGSNFKTPFFEYWVGDENVLDAMTMVGTVTGLEANTTYTFNIRARVRQTNDQTKIANGVTMQVGEGEAVDISAGAQFNAGQFYIGNFSAVGNTDAEGKLAVTITVADNSNISWLSFYNCNYVKGEDLSSYIADYDFALSTAQTNNDTTAYAAITGKERVDLEAAISKYASVDKANKDDLIEGKNALETASNAFVSAAATYISFAELNKNVASTLGVSLPTITTTTTAADLKVEEYIVSEYNAAKDKYTKDVTDRLGEWSNTPNNNSGESWDGTTGDNADDYYDEYNKSDRTMTQTVTLPAGSYVLIAKGRASNKGLLTLSDGTETVTFAHKSSTGRGIATDGTATFADDATYANENKGRGWEYRVLTFTSDGTTPTTLTFNWKTSGSQWVGLDDIELLSYPVTIDYSALESAFNDVTIPTLGFENGEYAPYTNAENLTNYESAKSMLDKKDAMSQSEVDALKNKLTSMTWTTNTMEMNAICWTTYGSDAAKDASNRIYATGWGLEGRTDAYNVRIQNDMENNAGLAAVDNNTAVFGKFDMTYGETTGYTMPLKANKIYKLSFKYGGWDNPSNTTVKMIAPDESELVIDAAMVVPGDSQNGRTDASKWWDWTGYFVAPANGNYVLKFKNNEPGEQRQKAIGNISLLSATEILFADDALPKYAPGTYPSVKINRQFTTSKWSTAVYPFAVNAGTIATLKSYENGVLAFQTATASVANVPFMIKNDGAITLENVAVSAAAAIDASAGLASLKGVYTATEIDNTALNYVLKENKIYKIGANAATVNPYRAYIQLATGSEARELTITVDGEATGISEVKARNNADGNIYNLNGQRVKTAKKGVYIMNGKTVIVK